MGAQFDRIPRKELTFVYALAKAMSFANEYAEVDDEGNRIGVRRDVEKALETVRKFFKLQVPK